MSDYHDPDAFIHSPEFSSVSEESVPRTRTKRLSWGRFKVWSKRIVAVLAGIPTLVVAIWIVVSVLVLTFHGHNLDLNAIGVPETLGKAGFTSEVATQRLRDAILEVQDRAHTIIGRIGVDTYQDLSTITIPKTDLSLQGVAATLRGVFPGLRHEIAGEFTESGKKLALHLRLNGKTIYSTTSATDDPDTADRLLGHGLQGSAFEIVRKTQPFVAAMALFGAGDLNAAEDAADDIIARCPSEDENVMWALILKGYIAQRRGDYTTAMAYYEKFPNLAVAHGNLGNIYSDSDYKGYDPKKALYEYETALWLDPKISMLHNDIAILYYKQNKLDAAIAEYEIAIRLDPENAFPHNNLGAIYKDQHKLGAAIAEFQIAIRLDPRYATPYYNMGRLLQKLAGSSENSGRRSQWLRDACRAFIAGGKLAPDDRSFPEHAHDIDVMMDNQGHCPPS